MKHYQGEKMEVVEMNQQRRIGFWLGTIHNLNLRFEKQEIRAQLSDCEKFILDTALDALFVALYTNPRAESMMEGWANHEPNFKPETETIEEGAQAE